MYNGNNFNNLNGVQNNNQQAQYPQMNYQQVSMNQIQPNNPKKKSSFGIIIGVIAIIAVAGIGIFFFLNNDKKEKSEDHSNNVSSSNSEKKEEKGPEISELFLGTTYLLALSEEGKIYGIGNVYSGLTDKYDTLTVLSEKADKMHGRLYYLDKGILYHRREYNQDISVLYEGVKDIYASDSGCVGVVTSDNIGYIDNGSGCGFNKDTNGFQKIARNVKKVIVESSYHAYISLNDELYVYMPDTEDYKMVLEDVTSYARLSVATYGFFLTKDGSIYRQSMNWDTKQVILEPYTGDVKRILSDEINVYFEKNDGNIYRYDVGSNTLKLLPVKNIEKMYFDYFNKLVYLNKDNKIVLQKNGEEETVIENDIKNLDQIYNFVRKS